MTLRATRLVGFATFVIMTVSLWPAAAQRAGGPAPAPSPNGIRLDIAEGTSATYRVREQLAGISFLNDAVGTTSTVTGSLTIGPDGAVNSAQSKLTVDLRTMKSDQEQRDEFVRGDRVLDTGRFPLAEFVPKRAVGLPWPFPSKPPAQAGFQLIGDMNIHGMTREVTWDVVATFNPERVAGRATTEFTFGQFGVPKPQLARLLSVDDTIKLEVELRMRRSPL